MPKWPEFRRGGEFAASESEKEKMRKMLEARKKPVDADATRKSIQEERNAREAKKRARN